MKNKGIRHLPDIQLTNLKFPGAKSIWIPLS